MTHKMQHFLAVWLSLTFKMANIKIIHLYIYAAYSSIIISVQWPLWLIRAENMTGIWISSLILWSLHSVLWDLFTLRGTRGSHRQLAKANGPLLLFRVSGWNRLLWGQVREGTSLRGTAGDLLHSLQGLERLWRKSGIGSSCKYSLEAFLLCFGNVKETWKG